MPGQPNLVLHEIPQSHPCLAVKAALGHLGLSYESSMLASGEHGDVIESLYGTGRRTVPGLLVDGEPVHGTIAIFEWLDSAVENSGLYPAGVADRVREAERDISEQLQSAGRMLIFGALHFRPEALGTFAGGESLDPAGTDFAIRMLRGAWRYIEITAVGIAAELDRLPSLVEQLEQLLADGVIGGDSPTAVDFQIGASLHLLARIGDVRDLLPPDLLTGVVDAWFEPGVGYVPKGALPAGWTPAPAGGA